MVSLVSDSQSPSSPIAIGKVKLAAKKLVVISEAGELRFIDSGEVIFRNDKIVGRGETVIEFADGSQITLGNSDNIILTEEIYSPDRADETQDELSTEQETLQDAQELLEISDVDNSREDMPTSIAVATAEESSHLDALAKDTTEKVYLEEDHKKSTKTDQPLFADDILNEEQYLLDSENQGDLEEKFSIFDLYKKSESYKGTPTQTAVERDFSETAFKSSFEKTNITEHKTTNTTEQRPLYENDILSGDQGLFYSSSKSNNEGSRDTFGSSSSPLSDGGFPPPPEIPRTPSSEESVSFQFERNSEEAATSRVIFESEIGTERNIFTPRLRGPSKAENVSDQPSEVNSIQATLEPSESSVFFDAPFLKASFEFAEEIFFTIFPSLAPSAIEEPVAPISRSALAYDDSSNESYIITEQEIIDLHKKDLTDDVSVKDLVFQGGEVGRLELVMDDETEGKAWEFSPKCKSSNLNIKLQATFSNEDTGCVSYSTGKQSVSKLGTIEHKLPDDCLNYKDVISDEKNRVLMPESADSSQSLVKADSTSTLIESYSTTPTVCSVYPPYDDSLG